MGFPEFTIRDMVESEHRLATEVLHLTHLHAVMGISMGGMQTFEWAVAYPDFMDVGVPMAGSPQSTSYDMLLWTSQMDALKLDPEWKGGEGHAADDGRVRGVQRNRAMNVTSPAYRVAHTSPQEFREIHRAHAERNPRSMRPRLAMRSGRRQAIIALDIPGEFGETMEQAAKSVHAKLLVVISPEDHMVNPTTSAGVCGT